jgi:chloride channel 3/4/5
MSTEVTWNGPEETDGAAEIEDPTDFTSYIDPSPVALDAHSPMDLVYELFVVCVAHCHII